MTTYEQTTSAALAPTSLIPNESEHPAPDFYTALVQYRKALAESRAQSRHWRTWESRRKRGRSPLLEDTTDPMVEQHMKLEVPPLKEETPTKGDHITTHEQKRQQRLSAVAVATKQVTRRQKWKFFKSSWTLYQKLQNKTTSTNQAKKYHTDAPSMPLEVVVAGCMKQVEETKEGIEQPEEPEQSESSFMSALAKDMRSPFSRVTEVEC